MMTILNRCFGLLFVVCAAVQLNDPDGWIWVAIYGAALSLCLSVEVGRFSRRIAWLLSGLAALGAAWLLYVAFGDGMGSVGADALHWRMTDPGSERLREGGGLLLISMWSGILALRGA